MWQPKSFEFDGPSIRGPLPGPLAAELIQRDEQVTSPSYTRGYPLAVRRGRGMFIEDMDGNQFLDFTAGIAVCATGHCHPRVVKAIQQQAAELIHMSGTDFYYAPQRDLSEKLAELAPGSGPHRVFLTNSGAESVEAALKLARYATGRKHIIAFYGAFHGRTMGALSLTASKVTQRRGFLPLVPEVSHVEYPNCYRCGQAAPSAGCCGKSLEQIEQDILGRVVAPDEVAAIFVEPIQGEGGYIVPPSDFLSRLRQLATRHGMLLVADEVQSGMGRTGKMFACEHWHVEPDIVCLAKGIASGMPLGAIVAREEVMQWPPGSHASTFGGNPVACAAALATIALLEEGLMDNARRTGELLWRKLGELQQRHRTIGQRRGLGLMMAIELVEDRATKLPAVRVRDHVVQRCFERGLLLLGCGKSAIRFCPPLIVQPNHVETAMEILDEALADAAREFDGNEQEPT